MVNQENCVNNAADTEYVIVALTFEEWCYVLLQLKETALIIDNFVSQASTSIFPLHFDLFGFSLYQQ